MIDATIGEAMEKMWRSYEDKTPNKRRDYNKDMTTVLIIEDEKELSNVLKAYLERA